MRRPLIIILCGILAVMSCSASMPIKAVTPNPLLCRDVPRLVLQISFFEGSQPSPEALEFLAQKIKRYTYKEEVSFVFRKIDATTEWPGPWADSLISNLHTRNYRALPKSDVLTVHILYVPLFNLNNQNWVGTAYNKRYVVIYKNRLSSIREEKIVLLHEMGHLWGLVNEENCFQNRAQDNGHCRSGCVMFHFVTDQNLDPDFDDACKRDLIASGGRI